MKTTLDMLPPKNGVEMHTIKVGGYGDSTSEGDAPILVLDSTQGRLKLYVWADINQEDPTHVIDLEGAKLTARVE